MMDPLDVLTRDGFKNTRQGWQFFDRLHEKSGGLLVMVQGGWSDGSLSANTHRLAMCQDWRTWNLPAVLREDLIKTGRDWMGTAYYRTEADGFDPHIHNNLIGDSPADQSALNQVVSYRQGRNGLANGAPDRNPYRPARIHNYVYLEDDMTPEEHKWLKELHTGFGKFRENELTRDQAERERDKRRFSQMVTVLGQQADMLTVIMNKTSDASTRKQLKKVQETILLHLKNDPDVTEEDNPSDDGLAERNMG